MSCLMLLTSQSDLPRFTLYILSWDGLASSPRELAATSRLTPHTSHLTSTPARKALSTFRLYPALRTRRDRVTFLDHPGSDIEHTKEKNDKSWGAQDTQHGWRKRRYEITRPDPILNVCTVSLQGKY